MARVQKRSLDLISRRHVPDERSDEGGDAEGQFVTAVARAMDVLSAFRRGDGPLGNAELAARTGLPKPTVSRLTYTLARCGYLIFTPERRDYELGGRALVLGYTALSYMDIRTFARPVMQELAHDGHFNIGIGTREDRMMMYTDVCEGESLVGLRLYPGSRIPILTTAMGRAYLAALDEAERSAVLGVLRSQYGDDWGTLVKGVEKATREVERQGFCVSIGDWQQDINGAAAPIRTVDGQRVYSLSLGGPAYLLSAEQLRADLGPKLVKAAREIEKRASAHGLASKHRKSEGRNRSR